MDVAVLGGQTRRMNSESSPSPAGAVPDAEWLAKWAPPCPDGNPQRLRHALGFWERSLGELEIRVALGGNDHGVCELIVEERQSEVYVRVLVCYDPDGHREDGPPETREYMDCPVRTWLKEPLGDRAVIDVDTDEELKLYKPYYLDNIPQPDHGYWPANRRRD
jgi:hypothetical protein